MTSFGRRRQPPDARNSLFYNTLHHWDFGFVWTLFNPLGSTGEASGIPTLPVVPGLAAVADRAASRLPKSPLTKCQYPTYWITCARRRPCFSPNQAILPGSGRAIHPLPERRAHPPSGSWEMWMAPNAPPRVCCPPYPARVGPTRRRVFACGRAPTLTFISRLRQK